MQVQSLDWEDPLEGRAWQPSPVFLPGDSLDRGACWTMYISWGHKESDTTEATDHHSQTLKKFMHQTDPKT